MTGAIAPNVTEPADLASRFVDVAALPWQQTRFAGIESKTLFLDKERGLLTSLVRMAPGAILPDHEHVLVEQTYVLAGRLVDIDGPDTGREAGPGEFVWRPAGSRHAVCAPEGGLLIGIFQMPNRFFEADGSVRDMPGRDWNAAWGAAARRRTDAD